MAFISYRMTYVNRGISNVITFSSSYMSKTSQGTGLLHLI